MKKFKQFMLKHAGAFAALAMVIGISTMNSACFIMYHQPKVPAAMDSYKK